MRLGRVLRTGLSSLWDRAASRLAALRFNPSRILCVLGYHRWYLIARLGTASAHIGCLRCPRQWGMNDAARALLPWRDVAEFHAEAHGYRP
jgi:hypothetical protein